jgi:hypothetical protein
MSTGTRLLSGLFTGPGAARIVISFAHTGRKQLGDLKLPGHPRWVANLTTTTAPGVSGATCQQLGSQQLACMESMMVNDQITV